MNKKVIYTCLFGNYDQLVQPEYVDETFDYICFTDSENLEPDGVWLKKHISYKSGDIIHLSRYPKLLPHIVLPMYETSLYLDANIRITSSRLYSILDNMIESNVLIAQVEHPWRDCMYAEIEECVVWGMITPLQRMRHYLRYKYNGLPHHWGLYENNIIFRRHNDDFVKNIDEEWWREYCKYSNRDQLSLCFVYYKHAFKPSLFFPSGVSTRNSDCVRRIEHSKERRCVRKNNFFELLIVRILNQMDKLHLIPSCILQG